MEGGSPRGVLFVLLPTVYSGLGASSLPEDRSVFNFPLHLTNRPMD